jgi:hypothetical protein
MEETIQELHKKLILDKDSEELMPPRALDAELSQPAVRNDGANLFGA